MGLKEFISSNILEKIDTSQVFYKSLIAIVIMAVGIFLGKIITIGLKKLVQKLDINKKVRGSFSDLFIVIIRWSIYIIFITIGLNQLDIPGLTSFVTKILITIPAFVGALILLTLGFAVAIYLKGIIEDAEVPGWDLISKIVFYFVLYVFGVYALKTALISLDGQTTNYIIIILTAIIAAGIAYKASKKEIRNH